MTNEEISLREYFEQRIRALERLADERWKAHEEVHAMGQRALNSAFDASQTKLHEINKFREQVLEERQDFLRRDIYDREHEALESKVEAHSKWIDNMTGRLVGAGAIILTLSAALTLLLRLWGK